MIFRYDQLNRFLDHLSREHRVVPLCEFDGQAGVILRHDVDLTIPGAHAMARLETSHGIRGSFFVLTTSPAYNIFTADNRRMLREMTEWGCEIGLHFDPAVYGEISHETLSEKVAEEAELLQAVLERPVRSVSLHNPSVRQEYPLFSGFLNAYDPAIFTPDCYISDSRRQFQHDLYEFLNRAHQRPVQLLLHPLHYTEQGHDYRGIFGDFVRQWITTLDASFRPNYVYDAEVQPDLLSSVADRDPLEVRRRRSA